MKTRSYIAILAAFAIVVTSTVIAAEKKEAKDIKCPVSGKAVNKDASVAYKDGKVYFCCENCPAAFAKNTKKFADKANYQLVATKQYKQKACPVSGRPCKTEHFTKVAGLKVNYCCPNCKGKVAKAKDDQALTMVFDDKAFKKGFEIAKKKKEDKSA